MTSATIEVLEKDVLRLREKKKVLCDVADAAEHASRVAFEEYYDCVEALAKAREALKVQVKARNRSTTA